MYSEGEVWLEGKEWLKKIIETWENRVTNKGNGGGNERRMFIGGIQGYSKK